jgi:Tfp pilus assembly protein PilF
MEMKDAAAIVLAFCSAIAANGCQQKEYKLGDAGEHFVAAMEALERGDKATAMAELNVSIEAEPAVWAYFQRARLHLEEGNEAAAVADCEAGLKDQPDNPDLKWLLGELKKPAAQRFKGENANPPQARK